MFFRNEHLKKVMRFIVLALIIAIVSAIFYYLHSMVTTYFYSNGESAINYPDEFNDAEYFIKHGHPEIKSLSIQFLTLLTTILVFSVTFSEKVINYNQATTIEKIIVTLNWIFLVLAIILDGIGLVFNSFALPFALQDQSIIEHYHRDSIQFYVYAYKALYAMAMSGMCFVIALICIVTSGVMKLQKNNPTLSIHNK